MEQIRHREEREVCFVFHFSVVFALFMVWCFCFILDFVSSFCYFDMLFFFFDWLFVIYYFKFLTYKDI